MTNRQQNHEVGDGCGDGQWHVQSGVQKIWERTVQTFKADIRNRRAKLQVFVRLRGRVRVASRIVERKGRVVRSHRGLEHKDRRQAK